MAARELIVLSSSPPGIPDSDCILTPPSVRRKSIPLTSSPELPSVGRLLTRRPAAYATGLRSGSHAAEVPADATFGFASAAALIKQQKLNLVHEDAGAPADASSNLDTRKTASSGRSKKPTKHANEPEAANTVDDMSAPKPKPTQATRKATRKTKQGALAGEHAAGGSQTADHAAGRSTQQVDATEAKPKARKPRAKKNDTEAQSKSRKVKAPEQQADIVEAEKTTRPVARKARKATGTESAHFSRANSVSEQLAVVDAVNDEPLALEQALSRRMDWTPPRDTTSPTMQHKQLQPPEEQSGSPKSVVSRATREGSFASLISAFGYNDQVVDGGPKPKRNVSGEAFTKRRKIELIDSVIPQTTVQSRETTPPKENVPKRKPRTITELATAAYRAPDISPVVSDFFAPRGDSATAAEPVKPEKEKPPARRRNQTRKTEEKTKKSTAKPKKAAKPMAQKLLSPETAKLRYNRQDILFGTSSQLAREDSPTFIRDLQQAMRESEATTGDDAHDVETLHLRPAAAGSGFSLVGRRKGLWAAAARDFDDGFLEIEEIEKSAGLNDASGPAAVQGDPVEAPRTDADLPSPTQIQTAATFIDTALASDVVNQNSVTHQEIDAGLMDIDQPPNHDELAVVRCTNADVRPSSFDDFDFPPSAQPQLPSSDYIDIDDIPVSAPRLKRTADYIDIDDIISDTDPVEHNQQGLRLPASAPLHQQYSQTKASLSSHRTALQSLPTNFTLPVMKKPGAEIAGVRAKSTLASAAASDDVAAPPKRRPGRPRKDANAVASEDAEAPVKAARKAVGAKSTKARDLPWKADDDAASQGAETSSKPTKKAPSTKGKKAEKNTSTVEDINVEASGTAELPWKSPEKRSSAVKSKEKPSTPRKKSPRKQKAQTDWMHIDEIEDSEDAMTPSPPRLRKGSASPRRLPLSLSQTAQEETSKSTTATLPAATTLDSTKAPSAPGKVVKKRKIAVKTKEAATKYHTTEVLAELFPQITQAITEEPRSKDHGKLSWHEHILLYDPIILEDLQEWLHAKGIRMHVPLSVARGGKAKAKAKPKKKTKAKAKAKTKAKGSKGKKTKDSDVVTDAETDADMSANSDSASASDSDVSMIMEDASAEPASEQSVVLVELDPWAVQRWCDANSVCCTFRESRNARKVR